MSNLPPSQSFQERNSQVPSESKPTYPTTSTSVPSQPAKSTSQTVLLALLFLTNIILIALLSLLLAKVWILEGIVKGGVTVGGTVDVNSLGRIENAIDVAYISELGYINDGTYPSSPLFPALVKFASSALKFYSKDVALEVEPCLRNPRNFFDSPSL
jgi:hypothetical protein